jgi:hypothetical protein
VTSTKPSNSFDRGTRRFLAAFLEFAQNEPSSAPPPDISLDARQRFRTFLLRSDPSHLNVLYWRSVDDVWRRCFCHAIEDCGLVKKSTVAPVETKPHVEALEVCLTELPDAQERGKRLLAQVQDDATGMKTAAQAQSAEPIPNIADARDSSATPSHIEGGTGEVVD